MTDKKLLQQALEALDYESEKSNDAGAWLDIRKALQERLAQPEPVAWGVFESNLHDMFFTEAEAVEMAQLKGTHAEVKPLYTAPPRPWSGLTDEEIKEIFGPWGDTPVKGYTRKLIDKIEAALKKKNT